MSYLRSGLPPFFSVDHNVFDGGRNLLFKTLKTRKNYLQFGIN